MRDEVSGHIKRGKLHAEAVAGLPETANMNEAFIKIVKAYGEAGSADD